MLRAERLVQVLEMIDVSNLHLQKKLLLPTLSVYETQAIIKEVTEVMERVESREAVHDLDMITKIVAMHVTKAVCEFRGMEVKKIVVGSKLKTPDDFVYDLVKEEFIK